MMPLGDQRSVTYFKRFKMEIDLPDLFPVPPLPEGFAWVAWHSSLVQTHAEVLFGSFCDEIDAAVFPSLGSRSGCGLLMSEISGKPGFAPEATWLLAGPYGYCGSIQGIRERSGYGAIQNVGVLPAYRGRGLGRALLLQSLNGFYRLGLGRAWLEVTAQNDAAVRLYYRLGFRRRKTLYKTVETTPILIG